MSDESSRLPWRRPPHGHFPGVPAWGAPTADTSQEAFEADWLPEVSPEWAWGGANGAGIRVCVLDSGVDAAHPRVGGVDRSLSVVGDTDGGIGISEVEPVDLAGHGTACASVIRSIAPGVSLTSVRILTDGRHGSGAALLAGLDWAIEEGFDLVNMSLSTTKEQFCLPLYELADRAYFRRCILVASAHNMPVRSYPWLFASVISVASHNEPDPMVYYYNPAPPVEFYARGVKVPVAWIGGREISSTGNSFATPHITAICARILSKHPLLTPFQLKAVLYLAASNIAKPAGGAHAST
ncbi:MAG: S8 family serine peptidase [Streptosporangiaceae bacterium]